MYIYIYTHTVYRYTFIYKYTDNEIMNDKSSKIDLVPFGTVGPTNLPHSPAERSDLWRPPLDLPMFGNFGLVIYRYIQKLGVSAW